MKGFVVKKEQGLYARWNIYFNDINYVDVGLDCDNDIFFMKKNLASLAGSGDSSNLADINSKEAAKLMGATIKEYGSTLAYIDFQKSYSLSNKLVMSQLSIMMNVDSKSPEFFVLES